MRNRLVTIVFPLALTSVLLAGCAAVTSATGTDNASGTTSTAIDVDATQTAEQVLAANATVHDTTDAATWDAADVVAVSLDGASATSSGDGVSVDGGVVTITAAGTYELSGTLDDGQVVVNSTGDGVVRLILNGVDISSSTGSAIEFTAADDTVVVLADGSSNSLSDTDSYADTADANAALYSAADLTITGTGSLTVAGNGNDGITGKDGLVIESGDISVTAVDDGIRGKDYLVVTGGTITVDAGGDALKSDNEDDADKGFVAISGGTLSLAAAGDGIQAQTDVVITGGSIDVTSGGGNGTALVTDVSSKGVKGDVIVVISGGDLSVDAADDAVHSNGGVHLSGGEVSLATGDDAVHADTALYIDGGAVTVSTSVEGLESASITIADGTVDVVSSDDGINASGDAGQTVAVLISGGTTTIDAEGDGFDSNGVASMTGGVLTVNGPTGSGNGALDVDGEFTVSGGELLAVGSSGMVISPSTDSAQGWISSVLTTGVTAGDQVQILDASGTVVGMFTATKSAQSVVFSSTDIVTGDSYTVQVDGAEIGTATAGEAAAGQMGGGGMGGGGGGERPSGDAPSGGGFSG